MDLLTCDLPSLKKIRSGKVREIFDLGETLLFVATDRISAFDCVLPNAIPRKGEVLTQLSAFWFDRLGFVRNHMITLELPDELAAHKWQLAGRSMVVQKAAPLAIECVVRGYLAGSGWKEYQQSQSIGGIALPAGMREAERLPEPLFTPSTKAESGHDVSIDWAECRRIVGDTVAEKARELSLRIYEEGRSHAESRGIILADTKFEFGLLDGELILIDECMTPDSSRFWPADAHEPGKSPPSFDKQFVRDYLEQLDWDKAPPAPALPDEVAARTSEKYLEAFERITGAPLA